MAALCTRVKVTWRDRYGQQATVIFHIAPGVINPSDGRILAIIAALEAACRAKAVRIELSQISGIVGSASAGVAYVSQDKALMNGIDGDGQAHNWKVPSLKPSILLADKETIDMTNASVTAYVAAVLAGAQGRGGAAITAVTDGHRTMGKRLKH